MNADIETRLLDRINELEARIERSELEARTLPRCFSDENGTKRVEIESVGGSVSLSLFNSQGKATLLLGVDGTGSGYISIRNNDGKAVAKLDVEQYGARLELSDNYFQSESAVVIQGNDCDNDGGWVKVISPSGDKELCVADDGSSPPSAEA